MATSSLEIYILIHLDSFGPVSEHEVINRYCFQKMLKVIIIYNEMSGGAAESTELVACLIRFSEEDTNEEMVFPHFFEVVPKSQTRLIIFIYNQLSCSWGSNTIWLKSFKGDVRFEKIKLKVLTFIEQISFMY